MATYTHTDDAAGWLHTTPLWCLLSLPRCDIVMKSLSAPCRIIADNGGVEGEVVVQRLLGQPFEMGYNAMDDRIENLLEAGVIDPAKVTKNGLVNSCSIAGIMLTTQAVMVEKRSAAGKSAGMGMGGGGMPGMPGMGMGM